MIVICEPICRSFSHEKVNSGFIYGLREAYPDETLRFYADETHISAIKQILVHDGVVVENIEYVPIKFIGSSSLGGAVNYYWLFKKMFREVKELGTDKVFFLSYSPLILYLIKKLKQLSEFIHFKFTFVLHGDFENIKTTVVDSTENINTPVDDTKPGLLQKLSKLKPGDYIHKFLSISRGIINWGIMKLTINPSKWLSTKGMLLFNSSEDFRYIALSPHIIRNAANYIDINKLNMRLVMFPTNFAKLIPPPENEYVRFGIFGYGDTNRLSNISYKLSEKNITSNYEIRIIGMDNRGTEYYPNITCPSPGIPLTRMDMEKYAEDIDVFLILYDKNKYKLGCSGTIIESLSYCKPILHFDNDCINTFNTSDNAIGICCANIDEYVNNMVDIIENYDNYKAQFKMYRDNIIKLRSKYAIKNSLIQLKESFTWE